MPRRRFALFGLVPAGVGLALLMGATAAEAAPAFVTTRLSLRAGPSPEYPAIALLEPGVQVEVLGCLEQYDWCDVAIGQDRGWIEGGYLQAPYEQQRVALPSVGAAIGLPIIGFSVGSYWGSHYRGRPWYGERERWDRPAYHRPPPGWGHGRPDFGRPDFGHGGRGPERPWRDGPGPSRFDGGRPDGWRHGPDGRGPGGRGPEGPRGPDRGGPDRGGPDHGGPGRGGPDRGGPDHGGPGRGGPDRGGPPRG